MENKEITIDIAKLFEVLRRYILLIVVATCITTVVSYVICNYFITKKYSATAIFYLENKETNEGLISSETINSGQKLVITSMEVLKSMDSIAQRVIDAHNLTDYSVNRLKSAITMTNVANTTVLHITLTMEEADLVVPVLETYSMICLEEFNNIINSGTIVTVNYATGSGSPVYPVTRHFVLAGFFIGLIGTYLVVFVKEILDTKVKSEDDLFTLYNIPVFAEIWSFSSKAKGNYKYYSYEQ